MTLPIIIPSPPSSGNSPASDDSSSNTPRTPVSPNMQNLALSSDQIRQPANAAAAQMKRKPSRRANTAERRATHNAVERQRRETLNGRFLDLAALLPNLSQIRRPSKSSIVNSSIAHIHASRRHRLLASRELRVVKLEADALRRELNEWRDRAALPRVEEPIRGDGFSMVLSGELEVIAAIPGDDDDDEGAQGGYGGYGDDEDDYAVGNMQQQQGLDELDDPRMGLAMLKNANANPFAHNLPPSSNNPNSGNNASTNGALHLAHILPRPSQANGGPVIVTSPTNVSFENPAMNAMYEPQQQQNQIQFPTSHFMQQQQQQQMMDTEKVAAWNAAHMYGHQQQQQQHHQQQQMLQVYTPPATSHGSSPGSSPNTNAGNPFNDPASQAFFVNFQRQQQQQQQMAAMQMYERDDTSSVGSGVGRGVRERSGSLGARSGSASGSGYGGSPVHHGSAGGYELGDFSVGVGAVPRRMSAGPGLQVNTSVVGAGGAWDADLGMGLMKSGLVGASPISVGGGGNGGGFAMMM
jgi:hypothetical protein